MAARILFVDDEPALRLTIPAILRLHGFEVKVAADVAEALSLIQQQPFDVLISDLNIGEPGDGFTVVSAMRRVQPDAVTIIITGFPAFETALQAIRSQVDDYLVKPTDADKMVEMIEQHLQRREPHRPLPARHISQVLMERSDEVMSRWQQACETAPELHAAPMPVEHALALLYELVHRLRSHPDSGCPDGRKQSAGRGRDCQARGVDIPAMVEANRLLRNAIAQVVQENLLVLHISYLIPDLMQISDGLDEDMQDCIRAYLEAEQRAA
jgi:DNA-binding response OmpR family regulator